MYLIGMTRAPERSLKKRVSKKKGDGSGTIAEKMFSSARLVVDQNQSHVQSPKGKGTQPSLL
jgi:hypothetical protein